MPLTNTVGLAFWAAAIANAILKLVDEHGAPNNFYLPELRAAGGPTPQEIGCVFQWGEADAVNAELALHGLVASYTAPMKRHRAVVRVEPTIPKEG